MCRNDLQQQSAEVDKQRRQLSDTGRSQAQLAKLQSDLARKEADLQALVSELKAREDAVAGNERRLDADRQALHQQRQEAELAGMKAQLGMQQAMPQLPAAPRSASRLQVPACWPCNACTMVIMMHVLGCACWDAIAGLLGSAGVAASCAINCRGTPTGDCRESGLTHGCSKMGA